MRKFWRTYAIAVALWCLAPLGLFYALAADGTCDAAAWVGAGIPVGVCIGFRLKPLLQQRAR